MSQIISSIPSAGLMEMPPLSKHTPLPTKATGADAALAHSDEGPHAQLLHLLFTQDLDLEANVGELLDPAGELFGKKDVRRFGNQVPSICDGVGEARQRPEGSGSGFLVIYRNLDLLDRRLLVGFFGGPILVETVGRQPDAKSGPGRLLGRQPRHAQDQRRRPRAFSGPEGVGGGQLSGAAVELTPLARADDDDPGRIDAVRRDEVQGLAQGACEPSLSDGSLDGAR
jgi:hypothetical protein